MKNEINGQRKSEKELFDEQIRSILREEMKMAQSHLQKPKFRYADVIRYYQ